MASHGQESASFYTKELAGLEQTYEHAIGHSVAELKNVITSVSGQSIIAVGSGGSFTVASLMCDLHERYTGRVSRPSTPLEVIVNPTLASASPIFFVTAEGKNPDIIEALIRAKQHSGRSISIITNRNESPFMLAARKMSTINVFSYNLENKDGYLATNSLLLDYILIARAYEELDSGSHGLPDNLEALRVGDFSIREWTAASVEFARKTARVGNLIILFSPPLRSIATDLESKLSEAALVHVQLADIRAFAHGRHLWMSQRPSDCIVLAIVEPSLENLWLDLREKMPETVETSTLFLGGVSTKEVVTGLVAAMHFVGLVANELGLDPARPKVQSFGRQVYYTDLSPLIAQPTQRVENLVQLKHRAFGGSWPSKIPNGNLERQLVQARETLSHQRICALVLDYDGTLCPSNNRDSDLDSLVASELERLVSGGLLVGIATGRGDSVLTKFRNGLSATTVSKLVFGLYNGGFICGSDAEIVPAQIQSEYLSHVARVVSRLKSLGVPIAQIRVTQPLQVSIRINSGTPPQEMWFVVADALRRDGLDPNGMVTSKHSIDILAPGVGKPQLVRHIVQALKIDPSNILTMGDQGAWPGNDSTLLEHKISVSVDVPSRRIDRGWKLAPTQYREVDATLWYLQRLVDQDGSGFYLKTEK